MKLNLSTLEGDSGYCKIAKLSTKTGDFSIYFEFPSALKDDLTDKADPLVISLIFVLMQAGGGSVEVSGATLSSTVAANMEYFSRIWHCWYPEMYKPVTFVGNIAEDEVKLLDNSGITTFSGGLDSAYINYYLKKSANVPLSIDSTVLIHGADVPLADVRAFDRVFTKCKRMTDDLGLELVVVKTNVRDYLNNWSHSHGSVVAGVLHFFEKKISHGITCDYSFASFTIPHGFNPFTDKYFSSRTFDFSLGGIDVPRTARAALIKDWLVGLENLHVCWEGLNKSDNCGHCEKCIRTKLNFKVVGVDHLACMPSDITLKQICKDSLVNSELALSFYKEALAYGIEHSTLSSQWVAGLKSQIHRWEKISAPPPSFLMVLYKLYLRLCRKLSRLLNASNAELRN